MPEQRCFHSDFCREFFVEGIDQLLAEKDMPSDKKVLLQTRREELLQSGK